MRSIGTRGRALLLLGVAGAAIAAVNGLDLPLTARRLKVLGGGEPLLDLRVGYGPEEAHRLLARLGASGRSSYLTMLWTVDLFLPALFGFALWVAIGAGPLVRWRRLALAAAAADYFENVAISALIIGFPDLHPLRAAAAAILTAVKFSVYALAAATAVAGLWMAGRGADGRDHASGGSTS
jgi:hypothetical protein